jgi:hypothetical protein
LYRKFLYIYIIYIYIASLEAWAYEAGCNKRLNKILLLLKKTFIPEEKHMLSERLSLYCLKFLFKITVSYFSFVLDGLTRFSGSQM